MRKIKYIVVHCTATLQTATPESIQRYWQNVLNWRNPGYHYLYNPIGDEIELLEENRTANGAPGYNRSGIHLSYIGGIQVEYTKTGKKHIPIDNRTFPQKNEMYKRIVILMQKYPDAKLIGHNEISTKDCPCFDVRAWFRSHQLSLTT